MRLIEDFNAIPSLEFLTASQIVIRVWNRKDIVCSISELIEKNIHKSIIELIWKVIEDRVKAIVGEIRRIEENLVNDLKVLVVEIGLQIRAWRTFISYSPHLMHYEIDRKDIIELPNDQKYSWGKELIPPGFDLSKLEIPVNHWTPYGTVDIEQLDKTLLRDDTLDISFRYNLACIDCLKEDIEKLFPLLSDYQIKKYSIFGLRRELLSYWTLRMSSNMPFFRFVLRFYSYLTRVVEEKHQTNWPVHSFRRSIHEIPLFCALRDGSKSGIEYFRKRLSPQIFNEIIQTSYEVVDRSETQFTVIGFLPPRPRGHFTDALFFLLSKLNEEHRNEYFENFYYNVFRNFIKYPFYGLYSKHVEKWMFCFIGHAAYLLLRETFELTTTNGYLHGYDLFKDCWNSFSVQQKDEVMNIMRSMTYWRYPNKSIQDHNYRIRKSMKQRIKVLEIINCPWKALQFKALF